MCFCSTGNTSTSNQSCFFITLVYVLKTLNQNVATYMISMKAERYFWRISDFVTFKVKHELI